MREYVGQKIQSDGSFWEGKEANFCLSLNDLKRSNFRHTWALVLTLTCAIIRRVSKCSCRVWKLNSKCIFSKAGYIMNKTQSFLLSDKVDKLVPFSHNMRKNSDCESVICYIFYLFVLYIVYLFGLCSDMSFHSMLRLLVRRPDISLIRVLVCFIY